MSQWMSATFLGTSSGGGPTESRNCSALVLDVVGNGSLWSTLFQLHTLLTVH
jgi:ribonuclease Z